MTQYVSIINLVLKACYFLSPHADCPVFLTYDFFRDLEFIADHMPSLCWTWNAMAMEPTFIYEGSKNLDDTAGTVFSPSLPLILYFFNQGIQCRNSKVLPIPSADYIICGVVYKYLYSLTFIFPCS